ncbi:hypothetical protein WDU94_014418, partial [Cyamophila willieti]
DYWLKFFLDAKIPKSTAEEYTLTFVENRIQSDMLLDLDKDYLNAMGITVMGDIIAILRHAKICHVQNAKKSMLSKQNSNTSLASTSSVDSNYRSVSLKKTPSTNSVKCNLKPSTNGNGDKPKVLQPTTLKSKVSSVKPVIKGALKTDRTKIVLNEKYVDKPNSNGVKIKVEKETSKPTLVRTPLVRKRLSSEMTKATEIEKHDESVSSDSDGETSEPVEDITRKMAKKSIFDRLGNPGQSKSSSVDTSERAVSSSTSPPVISSTLITKKVTTQPEGPTRAPKPGTLSYRMFPPHVHSTCTSPDDITDPLLGGEDRILVEIDQGDNDHQMKEDTSPPPPPSQVEYTVALPPDFQPASSSTVSKSFGSVFDRLGGKNNGQLSSSTASNPGKSILKLSSSSVRISKSSPTTSTTLVSTKRDIKTVSSLNNKLNLIRSQVKTEGVLGKPASLQNEKVPAKARIGNVSSTVPSVTLKRNPSTESVRSNSSTVSSIKSRLTLADQPDKKPVISSRLDVLAKKTLNSTPGHVKARIESEQQKFLSKARCGAGIKARLGFKTRGAEKVLNFDSSDLKIPTEYLEDGGAGLTRRVGRLNRS